ncbi:MAG: VanZ family protein [Lachnospiraceae bacterium]
MKANKKKALRIFAKVVFIIYIGFVFYFLIFSDWYGRTGEMTNYHYNIVLFKEIKRFWEYRGTVGTVSMFANLVGNVIIFLPFGFFMPMASKYRSFWTTLFYSFGLSLIVETFQLVTKVGCFDVDDLLLNTIGGIVGYVIFVICNAVRRNHGTRNKRKR